MFFPCYLLLATCYFPLPPATLTHTFTMNFRLTAVLFAVVLALVVGLLLYAALSPDPSIKADGPFAAITAAGLKAEHVTTVEIARAGPPEQKLVFVKSDGVWRLTAPAAAAVNSPALDDLVLKLLALEPAEYSGPMDRVDTGLTNPEVTVTVKASDKKLGERTAGVHLGNTTGGNEQAVTFMVSADDPKARPMAVFAKGFRTQLFRPGATDGKPAALVKWRTDFRPAAVLALDIRDPATEVDAVSVEREGKKLALARSADGWRFTTPDLGPVDVDGASEPDSDRFTGVRRLLNAVVSLRITGPADVTEDVPTAKLPEYGLAPADNPLRVTITPKGKPAQVVSIGKRLTEKDGKPAVPPRHYVKLDGDAAVFAAATDATDKLLNTLADPNPLRNRDLLPPGKLAQIDAVDSTVGGGFALRKLSGGTDPWGLYGGGDPADAQAQAVQGLLAKLSAPRVALNVLPAPDDAAFAGANLRGELKVWFGGVDKAKARVGADGKPPPQPAVSGEPITLRFGTTDKQVSVVRRTSGKETTDFEIPKELADVALQPRIKFVNARPPSFVPAQATNLVLFRDAARTEYVRNGAANDPAYPAGLWNLGDAKGPVADGDTVMLLLSRLAAAPFTLIAEKADDPKGMGLDPANPKLSARVSVLTERGLVTEEYQFGEKVKGDDKSVYFQAVGKPFVYAVPADFADRLRTADLSDKVAFRIDPTQVESIRFRGWRSGPNKDEMKVTVKLDGGRWVVDPPGGGRVEEILVRVWLEALQFPKSVGPAPVDEGKDPPAVYGLGIDAVNLVVLSRGGKGVMVTFGALSADKRGVYAKVNGKVYLLDAQQFGQLLATPPLVK